MASTLITPSGEKLKLGNWFYMRLTTPNVRLCFEDTTKEDVMPIALKISGLDSFEIEEDGRPGVKTTLTGYSTLVSISFNPTMGWVEAQLSK